MSLSAATADIHEYHDKIITAPYLYFHSGGMYSPKDAPASYSPGDGRSFIDFGHLKLERRPNRSLCRVYAADGSFSESPCYAADKSALLEIAVVEQGSFHLLGKEAQGQTYYCCTSEAIFVGACEEARKGHMLFSDPDLDVGNGVSMMRMAIWIPSAEQIAAGATPPTFALKRYNVRRTGYYNFFLSSCDETAGDVVVNGHTEWMNPWGYLPGTEWGNLPFFGSLSLFYLVMGLVWTVLMVYHVKELLPIQAWISFVLLFGMVQMAAKFFSYNIWNGDGVRDTGGLVFAAMAGVCKHALSRVLVVLVCTGYGVVKPSLGDLLPKILVLGALYFACALGLELLEASPHDDATLGDSSWFFSSMLFLATLACSAIDVTFYMWILQELQNTIRFLKQRRQDLKLRLFRRFRAVLVLSATFATAWALTTLALAPTKGQPWLHWRLQWALVAVWELCYVVICLAICVLWRPSANMQRYAYSSQLAGDDSSPDHAVDTSVGIEMDKGGRQAMDEDDEEYGGAMQDILPSANGDPSAAKMS